MPLTLFNESLLDEGNVRIIAIGRGGNDIREFCIRYGVAYRIEVMLNDNVREQREVVIDGFTIKVLGFSCLHDYLSQKNGQYRYLCVIMDDYYKEVYDTLISDLVVAEIDVDIYYYLNRENEIERSYREIYKDKPLEDLIVFRSGPHPTQYVRGMDFGDNSRALFEYMLSIELNKIYQLVWIVKDPFEYERFKDVYNVSFISYEWAHDGSKTQMDSYYHALCCSKYLFFTDAYGFARNCREDQIRVQLWHGCGFKSRVNFTRCEHRYEKMVVSGPAYKERHVWLFGLRDDQVLVTGNPKDDWVFHPSKRGWERFLKRTENAKVIFWLPTFREAGKNLSNLNEYSLSGDTGLPVVDTQEKLQRLNELLVRKGIFMVVKLHPYQRRDRVRCKGYSNIILIENEELNEEDLSINEMLGFADALISDYSNVSIDYLILDRPIGYLLDDAKAYGESRGFIFDPLSDYLPGAELYGFDDMLRFISEISDGIDSGFEKRKRLKKQLQTFDDDRSCQRVIDVLGIGEKE